MATSNFERTLRSSLSSLASKGSRCVIIRSHPLYLNSVFAHAQSTSSLRFFFLLFFSSELDVSYLDMSQKNIFKVYSSDKWFQILFHRIDFRIRHCFYSAFSGAVKLKRRRPFFFLFCRWCFSSPTHKSSMKGSWRISMAFSMQARGY